MNKSKKCKLTEAEKKEKIAVALAKKKECEHRALMIVERWILSQARVFDNVFIDFYSMILLKAIYFVARIEKFMCALLFVCF